MLSRKTLLFSALLLHAQAHSEDILQLVHDIAPDVDTDPHFTEEANYVESQQQLFFKNGRHSPEGEELWRTDGTAAGTYLVRDILVGRSDSLSGAPTYIDWQDRLYVSAASTPGPFSLGLLWSTDGTEAGSLVLREDFWSIPRTFMSTPSLLYFQAAFSIGLADSSIWRSDGTSVGTYPITDPWIFGSVGSQGVLGDKLLFEANYSLWITDGTVEGTSHVYDLEASVFVPLGTDRMVMRDGTKLWVTDGTTAGTTIIADLPQYRDFIPLGDKVVFVGFETATGFEPWVTDGTAAGTVLLADVDAGGTEVDPRYLTRVDDLVYFQNGVTSQNEIWKTDGTAAGTSYVATTASHHETLHNAVGYEGYLYFSGQNLMRSDGTEAGTGFALSVSDPTFLTSAMGYLWFEAESVIGRELHRSDGMQAGTYVVADLHRNPDDSRPDNITAVGDSFIFNADRDFQTGLYNGDGTRLVPGSFVPEIAGGNDVVYMAVGANLWRSDGTLAGTYLIDTLSSTIEVLAYLDDELLFGTSYPPALWRSDGTAVGTIQIVSVGTSGAVESIEKLGDSIVFHGQIDFDHSLWITDGTGPGTAQLRQFNGSARTPLTRMGDEVFFAADTPELGVELWKSDGTVEGTTVIDFNDIQGGSYPTQISVVNDILYFVSRQEIWVTDGTEEGIRLLFEPDTAGMYPSMLTAAADKLFFLMSTPESGQELWTTRGPGDTYQVADIFPGEHASNITIGQAVGGTLFFQANDNVSGEELWRSDGTPDGTMLAADVVAGSGGSIPSDIAFANGKLYFSADDGVVGFELWSLQTNIAPWFTTPAPVTAVEHQLFDYTPGIDDANPGDTWSFDLMGAPAGMSFDNISGALTWTPGAGQAGVYAFTLIVSDQTGLEATMAITLEVQADTDADGVEDVLDNCTEIANADQRDTNGDGFGNACDADVTNDGIVNFVDLQIYQANLFVAGDFETDNNGDGITNFLDLLVARSQFFGPPGPSGLL